MVKCFSDIKTYMANFANNITKLTVSGRASLAIVIDAMTLAETIANETKEDIDINILKKAIGQVHDNLNTVPVTGKADMLTMYACINIVRKCYELVDEEITKSKETEE